MPNHVLFWLVVIDNDSFSMVIHLMSRQTLIEMLCLRSESSDGGRYRYLCFRITAMRPIILVAQVAHADTFVEIISFLVLFLLFLLVLSMIWVRIGPFWFVTLLLMRPFLFFFLLLFLFLFLLLLFIKIQAVCSIEIISVRLPHKVIHGLETYLPLHLLIHKPLHQKSTFPSYFINLSFNSFNFLHFLPIKNFAPIRFPMLIVLELLFSDSKLICCFEGISVLLDLSGSLLLFPFDHFSHSLLSFLVASHIKENISVVIVRLRWYGFN